MKISKIEFSNFRNFAEKGELFFDTNGKINIIYGLNGDGKTTFHQLFQWIFYGEVHFNKTSEKEELFNNEKFKKLNPGENCTVMGGIEFEHAANCYYIKREKNYRKGNFDNVVGTPTERLELLVKNSNKDWVPLKNEQALINKFLPKSLSQYFFFEGEGMVSDLKKRGAASAASLKSSIYYLFDLQLYNNAIIHIGDSTSSTTVLGKLDDEKSENADSSDVLDAKEKLEEINSAVEEAKTEQIKLDKKRDELETTLFDLNEKIGESESSADLNKKRDALIGKRKNVEERLDREKREMGELLSNSFSGLLVAKKANDAKKIIFNENLRNKKLPKGLTRELVDYCLDNKTCICERKLTDKEIELLESYKAVLPPNSYKVIYDQFIDKIKNNLSNASSDIGKIKGKETDIISSGEEILGIDSDIDELDEQMKNGSAFDDLIVERKRVTEEFEKAKAKSRDFSLDFGGLLRLQKSRKQKYDNVVAKNGYNISIDKKIEIMQSLKEYYSNLLETESKNCRNSLSSAIDSYLDKILTTNKDVFLSENFELRVTDEYGDEYKSEGQFAVVSFAYIMGILKTLKDFSENKIPKEYPLVLDGPFSKLDKIQEERVIKYLPEAAQQVIILSKDDLSNFVDFNKTGYVYLIQSNVKKNNAKIVQAMQPDIDYYFSDERAKKLDEEKLRYKENWYGFSYSWCCFTRRNMDRNH